MQRHPYKLYRVSVEITIIEACEAQLRTHICLYVPDRSVDNASSVSENHSVVSSCRVGRAQEAATGGGSDGVNQPGYSAADIENETTDNSTINTANTADESNAADDVGDATDAEVVLGERNGWCKVRACRRGLTHK